MTDFKFELLTIFYNHSDQTESHINLVTVYLKRQDELDRALEDFLSQGWIKKTTVTKTYKMTPIGNVEYEQEQQIRNAASVQALKEREQNEKEREKVERERERDKKETIRFGIGIAFHIINALGTIISVAVAIIALKNG